MLIKHPTGAGSWIYEQLVLNRMKFLWNYNYKRLPVPSYPLPMKRAFFSWFTEVFRNYVSRGFEFVFIIFRVFNIGNHPVVKGKVVSVLN
jgi:hypothetical protein